MENKEKLKNDIQSLREQLQQMISDRKTFVDPEILTVSTLLDEMLIEYEALLEKEKEK
ncbi:MAG: aspartyl-phosphate phosphatase Spo0E family protein [Clostridia bacterium]|nr:aspartyl-phosphate phosphatase Spo0E family protein [Clostridia bacterium]